MYKIDKDVEVPTITGRGGSSAKYPWFDMDVGDSFFVPLSVGKHVASMGTPLSLKTAGQKYIRRTVTENGIKGVRFWRVK